jgi:hypothetical protein
MGMRSEIELSFRNRASPEAEGFREILSDSQTSTDSGGGATLAKYRVGETLAQDQHGR